MTTLPPIQPRPILCQPATVMNTNFYSTTNDLSNNNNSNLINNSVNNNNNPPLPPAPLSSYEEFLKRLREFHRCRQTSFRYLPTIAGQVVDLQALYTTVVAHGGWDKVNDRQLWSAVANNFGIDSTCLNGTQALKNIYIRYLYAFEKISNGENIDSRDDDDEDSKRRNVSQLQRVPQSYNHAQHSVSDSMRVQYGLFRDFVRRSEYEKIELALLCGFPNELTFSLNTLLLLSSTNNNHTFQLQKCPRLLDIIFRHIGLFLPDDTIKSDHCLRILYDSIWSKHLDYHMDQFWVEFCSPHIVQKCLNVAASRTHNQVYENFNFNLADNYQQQEIRIEQVLMIIRNLSFDRSNATFLLETMRSPLSTTYAFLLLTSYCEKKLELQKHAFDIWSNLALYMHLRSLSNDEGRLVRDLLNEMLNGNEGDGQHDRLKIIRALEIIANLAHAGNDNGIYLIDFIGVIVRRLIHVSDILILVHTLECLYQLSELGEQLCNAILSAQSSNSVIMTLIDLLTIEARSFSSQTIKTIKIVEMSSGPVLLPSYHQPPPIASHSSSHSQSVVLISSSQQQHQQSTYAVENTEMNKTYYGNNNKLIMQQFTKPLAVASVISSGNLLTVATPSVQNTHTATIVTPNASAQTNPVVDKKRKIDSISETIAAVVNGTSSSSSPSPSTPPPPKRPRPSRPRPTPTKTTTGAAAVAPAIRSRLLPSSSVEEDTSSMESNSTSNSIQSTMADLLDRCSSPSSQPHALHDDVRACLNDLCRQVVSLFDESSSAAATSIVYNPIPSPVFKRKAEEQSAANKRSSKNANHVEEQTPKKKRSRTSAKKSAVDVTNIPVTIAKKEEPVEQETPDVKPILTTANVVIPSPMQTNLTDYVCDWDNCRRPFPTARAVFHHACSAHVKHSSDYVCLWNGCDRLKRQKWALISHIQERHCSEVAFRQAKLKSATSMPATIVHANPTTNAPSTTAPLGYAPDAAWLAIRRHMQMNSFDDLIVRSKEGPLTKSIRLTAALILRNIARHSSIGKQYLRQYEQHIANLALESSEASSTLSSCLFELYN